MLIRTRLIVLACIWTAHTSSTVQAQNQWPGFRNDGSGVISVERIPTKWSPDEGVAWRAEIPGYGQSAPVVYNDRVFLTSSDGPWQESGYVHAFDLRSGKKVWTTEVKASTKVENDFRNSRAAPTCVVDDKTVISFFLAATSPQRIMMEKSYGQSRFSRCLVM